MNWPIWIVPAVFLSAGRFVFTKLNEKIEKDDSTNISLLVLIGAACCAGLVLLSGLICLRRKVFSFYIEPI